MGLDFASMMTILIAGVCTGGVYGLFASGFSFQIGALRIYDFSFGAWIMMAMYLTYFMIDQWGYPLPIALLILFTVYFLVSYFLGKNVMIKGNDMVQMLVTIGITIVLQNLAILLFTAFPRTLNVTERAITLPGGITVGLIKLAMLVLSAVILIGFNTVMKRTWIGKTIRAVIQEKEAAYLVGVNADQIKTLAYALSYILVAASGVMLLVLYPVEPTVGAFYQTMSFFICILAGMGNLKGTFFCGILIGVLNAILNTFFVQFASIALFAIFVLILIFRPQGLFAASKT